MARKKSGFLTWFLGFGAQRAVRRVRRGPKRRGKGRKKFF